MKRNQESRGLFSSFFILLLLFCSSCATPGLHTVQDRDSFERQALLFGHFSVGYNGKKMTNVVFVFSDGSKYESNGEELMVFEGPQKKEIKLMEIELVELNKKYSIGDLMLKVGPRNSRTYYGEVEIVIQTSDVGQPKERWTWNVKSKFDEHYKLWMKLMSVKSDMKTYRSLARKIGDKPYQERNLSIQEKQTLLGI